MRAAMTCGASPSRPKSASSPSWAATTSSASVRRSALTSWSLTMRPAAAKTSAQPAPMLPAPMTAMGSVFMSQAVSKWPFAYRLSDVCGTWNTAQWEARMFDLTGKTILVTGASKGIGAATVAALGAAGGHVVAHFGSARGGAGAAPAAMPRERVKLIGADLADSAAADQLWREAVG